MRKLGITVLLCKQFQQFFKFLSRKYYVKKSFFTGPVRHRKTS